MNEKETPDLPAGSDQGNQELASLVRVLRSRQRFAVLTWHLENTYHDTEEAARNALAGVPPQMRAAIIHRGTGQVWSSAAALPIVTAFFSDELGDALHRQGALGDITRPLKRR